MSGKNRKKRLTRPRAIGAGKFSAAGVAAELAHFEEYHSAMSSEDLRNWLVHKAELGEIDYRLTESGVVAVDKDGKQILLNPKFGVLEALHGHVLWEVARRRPAEIPIAAETLLCLFLSRDIVDQVIGDLTEKYNECAMSKGVWRARLRLWARCSWTSFPNSSVARSKRCASRSRPDAPPWRAPMLMSPIPRASSWSPR